MKFGVNKIITFLYNKGFSIDTIRREMRVDDYFDYVFDKANGFYNYTSKTNYKENYVIDVTRYLADDDNYVKDEKYEDNPK